jgi:uncharacterized membrane protein YkgB
LGKTDEKIIDLMRRIFFPFARFAIFLPFFWFGLLKVIEASPASPLVLALLGKTMPFISPDAFLVGFGIFEMIIGISLLIPHFERPAIALLLLHLFTTMMPLFILPSLTWQRAFVPTMEGQYIIKNILFIALAMGIAAHLRPRRI